MKATYTLTLIVLLLSGCSKSSDPTPAKVYTNLNGAWQFTTDPSNQSAPVSGTLNIVRDSVITSGAFALGASSYTIGDSAIVHYQYGSASFTIYSNENTANKHNLTINNLTFLQFKTGTASGYKYDGGGDLAYIVRFKR